MSEAVLDSSAVLSLLLAEPGAEIVQSVLPGALLSTVNFAEVLAKLVERGMPSSDAVRAVEALGVELVDFNVDQAHMTGQLRASTRALGLSLGDRACLALGSLKSAKIYTAVRTWENVLGLEIVVLPDVMER